MRTNPWTALIRKLISDVPDAILLERYEKRQDEEAFAQVLVRYSRLVWGQCRNLMNEDTAAEDAFQATFLLLSRSVSKLQPGQPIGPWLHGAAYRICRNAQRARSRRFKRERQAAKPEASRPVADCTWDAAYHAVAEEVQRLPEPQRTAFVLCCLEGHSTEAAAATLGVTANTLSARVSRAKQALLARFAKRDLGAGVLALGGVAASMSTAPAHVIEHALALIPTGSVIPSSVHTLLQGATLMTLRIKLLAAGVFVATGLSLGSGTVFNTGTAQSPDVVKEVKKAAEDLQVKKKDILIEQHKAEEAVLKARIAQVEMQLDQKSKEVQTLLDGVVLRYDKLQPKYEYEAVPQDGFDRKQLEAKLEKRKTDGWEFVGQVTLKSGSGPTASLVFRKPNVDTTAKLSAPREVLNGDIDIDVQWSEATKRAMKATDQLLAEKAKKQPSAESLDEQEQKLKAELDVKLNLIIADLNKVRDQMQADLDKKQRSQPSQAPKKTK